MPGAGRRVVALLTAVVALSALAGCTSSEPRPRPTATAPVTITRPLVVGGADVTESLVLQALYGQLLTEAGFTVRARTWPDRERYLPELVAGRLDVVPEYAATVTEYLNRQRNGAAAPVVATPDVAATTAVLRRLGAGGGLAALAPARAANQNGFAISADFARDEDIGSLSELAARREPVVLAATPGCERRPYCAQGLRRVYGLEVASVLPLGLGTNEAKRAVIDGEAELALVATTDGTLTPMGLTLLADDRRLQLADNVVPLVHAGTARDRRVAAALDPLAAVLTTADLADLNEQVDGGRRTPEDVAREYLRVNDLV